MPTGYQIKDQSQVYYITLQVVYWIDIFTRSSIGDLSGTLRDFKKYTSKQLTPFIAGCAESRKEWMLRLFAHAAKRQNKQGEYQVWTHENHAKETFSNEFLATTVSYIHQNPVRAGLVERAEDYLYSSARSHAELDSMINVLIVDRQWKTYT